MLYSSDLRYSIVFIVFQSILRLLNKFCTLTILYSIGLPEGFCMSHLNKFYTLMIVLSLAYLQSCHWLTVPSSKSIPAHPATWKQASLKIQFTVALVKQGRRAAAEFVSQLIQFSSLNCGTAV